MLNASPFGLDVNDDDDGAGRDGKLSWHAGADNAWQNPSIIGTMQLSTVLGIEDENELASISIFPNPFVDNLRINGLKNELNYIITDISGRIIQTGKTRGNIETSLFSGLYNLTLIQNSGYSINRKLIKN